MLTEEFKKIIKNQSLNDFPKESCGLFILTNGQTELVPVSNIAENPEEQFLVDPKIVKRFRPNLIGFYHSHPSGDFSHIDTMISEKLNLPSFIYKVTEDEFSSYYPIGLEIPFENRPFLGGVFDCFSLVHDYFHRKFNISITDFTHELRYFTSEEQIIEWEKTGNTNIFKEHFLNNGFVVVNNLKNHDIILIRYGKIKMAAHCMIYIENGSVLRHFSEFSGIEPYNTYFKNRTIHILRHKTLC